MLPFDVVVLDLLSWDITTFGVVVPVSVSLDHAYIYLMWLFQCLLVWDISTFDVVTTSFTVLWHMYVWCGYCRLYCLVICVLLVWVSQVLLSCDMCTFGVITSGSTLWWHIYIWCGYPGSTVLWDVYIWCGYHRFYCLMTHLHLAWLSQVLLSCDMYTFSVAIPEPTFLWQAYILHRHLTSKLGYPSILWYAVCIQCEVPVYSICV